MMGQIFLALAGGCASAALFASVTSGALISLVLMNLAPLPLLVTALGWGPLSATIGGVLATIGLGVTLGLADALTFAVGVALPACWLGHLSLLGRPVGHGTSPDHRAVNATPVLEWYPQGRILLWIAGFAAFSASATLLTFGSDTAALAHTMRAVLLRFLALNDTSISADTEQRIEIMVSFAPAAAAVVGMITLTFNLWLAAKITATSGRLARPWPDLKATALPAMTWIALGAAAALCFGGGILADLAKIAATALTVAYALAGFAVLHTLTLALKSRAFWLGSTYAFAVVFIWPILALAALGVADAVFGLRRRYLRTHPSSLPVP